MLNLFQHLGQLGKIKYKKTSYQQVTRFLLLIIILSAYLLVRHAEFSSASFTISHL